MAFCDVDGAKIARGFYQDPGCGDSGAARRGGGRRVPIVHFRAAAPPLLLCVKPGLTGGLRQPASPRPRTRGRA